MANVFTYTNYRTYLLDYYTEKKGRKKSYSYNGLAQRAGFKNKGFLYNVMHGKKNLSKTSIIKISTALGHSKSEAEYFENLVFFNQCDNLSEREYFFKKMNSVRTRNNTANNVRTLRKDQYEFYSVWYHSAVRSLIDMFPVSDDYAWLARNICPPITPLQARKSVELLARLGLITRNKKGQWQLSDKHITTGNEIIDMAALHYHRDTTRLAASAIDKLPRHKRNITGITMGISQQAYDKIVEETNAFRKQIVAIVDEDDKSECVYQMNFHLFPLSRCDIKGQL